jgi:ABC-type Fe3+/spermidine/putrescine transport system ATPase subunit
MVTVRLEHLSKRFEDGTLAVEDVSLTVGSGEILTLLGPSGSGKTTLLRLVAGVDAPDAGRIRFDNRTVTRRPPDRREIGIVFQEHALFPHLTVGANAAFGLEARGIARDEIVRRVGEALEHVGLGEYERRRVERLSMGEQQRVALARALVTRPRVLLLDDPLASLDDRMREEILVMIRRVQRERRTTTIYVCHDQSEGLALADRVAVMIAGRIVQVGAPREVWERPANRPAAAFMGLANLLPGMVAMLDGPDALVALADGSVVRVTANRSNPDLLMGVGASVTVAVRPEQLQFVSDDAPGTVAGTVASARLVGGTAEYVLEMLGQRIMVRQPGGTLVAAPGERLRVAIPPERAFLLP